MEACMPQTIKADWEIKQDLKIKPIHGYARARDVMVNQRGESEGEQQGIERLAQYRVLRR